jgi:IMP dehydrogenase
MKTFQFPLGLSFDDVLLVPQYSEIWSRSDVDLSSNITKNIKLQIPIISANMSDVTGIEMAKVLGKLGGLGVLPRFNMPGDEADMVAEVKKDNTLCGASIGCKELDLDRLEMVLNAGADVIFLDVAHGHMKRIIDFVKQIKSIYKERINLVAGNIATSEGATALFVAGADAVKVGVGPGSICTTRIETGSGVPQMTAILSATEVARKMKRYVIADGGTKCSGDIVKALAGGASAVMSGYQFAGTDKAPGKLIVKNGEKFKVYNASTSSTEKSKYLKGSSLKHIEGVESIVPYKGSLDGVVEKLVLGIRSGFSYSGAVNIESLWERAKFVRLTNNGIMENGSHNVITKK